MATYKMIGRVDTVDQDFIIERTGSTTSGPHTINVDDGAWYLVGRDVADVTSGTSGTTINVSSGHDYEAGDVVDVWDVSADASLGTRTVESVTATTIVVDSAITVATGDLVYEDGDLLGHLTARCVSQDTTNLAEVRWTIDSDGLVTITLGEASDSLVVTWDDAGSNTATEIRDWLRFTDDDTSTTATGTAGETATRVAYGSYYPSKSIRSDLEMLQGVASQASSDTGLLDTVTLATVDRVMLSLRYQGPPRASTWNEYETLRDFWTDVVNEGVEFRYYPDTSTTLAPYSRVTNPYGWDEYVVRLPAEFNPHAGRLQANFRSWFDLQWQAHKYVP